MSAIIPFSFESHAVRVQVDAVATIGLVGQAEADEVEEDHAATGRGQIVEHRPPIERAGGEAVQYEDGGLGGLGDDEGFEGHGNIGATIGRCGPGEAPGRCGRAAASAVFSPSTISTGLTPIS